MNLKTLLMGAIASAALAPAAFAERGSDGNVSIIYWQAPSIMNPYLSGGTKDLEAASLVIEPLARYDETGAMVPWLAQSVPTVENGGVAADLKSITWKLRPGLLWSDGTPVTSADVRFTWQYCTAEGGGCAQSEKYNDVADVETPDDLTVVVHFSEPTSDGMEWSLLPPTIMTAPTSDIARPKPASTVVINEYLASQRYVEMALGN